MAQIVNECKGCGKLQWEYPDDFSQDVPPEVVRAVQDLAKSLLHKVTTSVVASMTHPSMAVVTLPALLKCQAVLDEAFEGVQINLEILELLATLQQFQKRE